MGGEVSGSSGHLVLSIVEQTKVYERANDDANAKEKMSPMANQTEQKREANNGSNGGVLMAVQKILDPCLLQPPILYFINERPFYANIKTF